LNISFSEITGVLEVYNLMGERVITVVNDRQQAGSYNYRLNANESGLSTGVYLLKFKAGNTSITQKLIQMK
jgi:hypothetical protein